MCFIIVQYFSTMKKTFIILALLMGIFGAAKAQNQIQVGEGDMSDYGMPLYVFWNYGFSQQIYTQAELGIYCDFIHSIAFRYTTGREMERQIDVYLKHTDKQQFESHSDWEAVEATDLVYSGPFNVTNETWINIDLNEPFFYDGEHNLLMVVYDHTLNSASSQGGEFMVFEGQEGSSLRMFNDYNPYDPMNPEGAALQEGLKNTKNQLLLTTSPGAGVIEVGNSLNIYPNPANGMLHIEGSDMQNVSLFNLMGQEMISSSNCGNEVVIETTNLPKGIYFVQVKSLKGITTQKIVVE